MTVIPKHKTTTAKIIDVCIVEGKLTKKPKVRYNKDGSIDRRKPNKVAGKSSEVYPFVEEEVEKMIEILNKHIEEAPNENRRWIASRNKLLFLVGVNLSLRVSDLSNLTYRFFMNDDGTFKEYNSLMPKKTKKTKKFVKIFFNQVVKTAITNYLEEYPMESLDDYLFKSREGDGHLTEISVGRIVKSTAAEAGIKRNVNSHSLRKSFGYHVWHNAKDKEKAIIMLMAIFNHSSVIMTKKYIGLMDDEIEDVFHELNLGLENL